MDSKMCHKCGLIKTLTDFYKDKSRKDKKVGLAKSVLEKRRKFIIKITKKSFRKDSNDITILTSRR